MKAQKLLQALLAVLTIIGTALLGAGQADASLTLLMCIAAPSAVVCTDIFKWFCLSRPLANLAAIGSVAYAVVQFVSAGIENQLLSVANLLVYLQLILLFQEKSHRLNWQLLVLSLLEVVVAAAMSLNFRFFILLLVYLFLALLTMALLFMLREASRFDTTPTRRPRGRRGPETRGLTSEPLDPRLRWLVGAGPHATTSASPAALVTALLQSGYLQQVGSLGAITLVFATILFYMTPRLGSANWQGGKSKAEGMVGFSQQITFGELTELLQDDQLALRISFFDEATDTPLPLMNAPYLRGALLTHYGETVSGRRWSNRHGSRTVPLEEAPTREGLVRQEVWLEPSGERAVFGVHPLWRLPDAETTLRHDRASGLVVRRVPLSGPADRFHYVVGSYGFRHGWQASITPIAPGVRAEDGRSHASVELADCLGFSPYPFPGLRRVAEEALREANATHANNLIRARVLEQHFLQPGRYQYSLRLHPATSPDVDPVEDFVANHRTGHCEFFAAALVIMLRSQQIPARLVVGYHGGEYNALGNYYLVRQRDAHAWVEVLLNAEEIQFVNKSSLPLMDVSQGGWLRLDPTPGADLKDDAPNLVWNRFDDFMDYAEFLWSDYVSGLNRERQRETLHAPLWEKLTDRASKLFDFERWRRWTDARIAQALRNWGIVNDVGELSWRVILGVMIVLVLAMLVARAMVVSVGALMRWCGRPLAPAVHWLTRRLGRGPRRRIEFYDRLERLFARKGLRRHGQQTPREFLLAAEHAESIAAHRALWSNAAWHVVDAFYRVRFGGAALDNEEARTIEQALRQVAAGLEGRSAAAAERT